MSDSRLSILRARVVLPVSRPPIHDGAVAFSGERLVAVGSWPELAAAFPGAAVEDLGAVLLLPGLVNAHCHLDYTDMAGQLLPGRSFSDWVKGITTLKGTWSTADFEQSWLHGAEMLASYGVTTVANIEAMPELLPVVRPRTPLRVFSFLEMTGVRSRRDPALILQETEALIRAQSATRGGFGLSPHAPYSTTPELLRRSAESAARNGWRVTTHVAESSEEFDMFMYRRGSLYEWLSRNERDMSDCGLGSPVQHVEHHGLLNGQFLAAHVNHLWSDDAARLARSGASVVHCPRSHLFFHHRNFPWRELHAAGVNVCLGTDSLATVAGRRGEKIELDLFAEMRAFIAEHVEITPTQVVEMVTTRAAQALGLGGQAGELVAGAWADLTVLPLPERPMDPYQMVLEHRGHVSGVMIAGEWVRKTAVYTA